MAESLYYLNIELSDSDSSALLDLSMQQVSTYMYPRDSLLFLATSQLSTILAYPSLSTGGFGDVNSWNETSSSAHVWGALCYGK